MKKKIVALVRGDGAAPEMMAAACAVAIEAAKKDGIKIVFEETPMGWNAYEKYGDTLPQESFKKAVKIGIIFFGGVGDPKFDKIIGVKKPEMNPERKCLLALRKTLGLLVNFRPIIYYKELAHLTNVKPEMIPEEGVQQIWVRYLLEDSYFGNEDLMAELQPENCQKIGVKLKKDVTGEEELVTDLAYFRRSNVEKFIRAAFAYAKSLKLPLISIDKANVMARYDFWRKIVTRIGKMEFPEVPLRHQLVDSANALLFTPAKLHGVIVCGNEQGDILTDGAAAALGSLGLMCSVSINPSTNQAMFESGAGTVPALAGQDKANPIGRILAAAMMLRHLGAVNGAKAIEEAVKKALKSGCRTVDMSSNGSYLGTRATAKAILSYL